MPNLRIAEDIDAINSNFELYVNREFPGFQIAPEIDIETAVQAVELNMGKYVTGFALDVPQTSTSNGPELRHIDATHATHRKGSALHHNEEGEGNVELVFLRPKRVYYNPIVLGNGSKSSNAVHRASGYYIGEMYKGRLCKGMKTVFSEGIHRSPLLARGLPATAHKFTTDGKQVRVFTRYTWSGLQLAQENELIA